eukprot:gene7976-1192_t
MGRADYHGPHINQAARYMDAAAHGGQIVCEEQTAKKALNALKLQVSQSHLPTTNQLAKVEEYPSGASRTVSVETKPSSSVADKMSSADPRSKISADVGDADRYESLVKTDEGGDPLGVPAPTRGIFQVGELFPVREISNSEISPVGKISPVRDLPPLELGRGSPATEAMSEDPGPDIKHSSLTSCSTAPSLMDGLALGQGAEDRDTANQNRVVSPTAEAMSEDPGLDTKRSTSFSLSTVTSVMGSLALGQGAEDRDTANKNREVSPTTEAMSEDPGLDIERPASFSLSMAPTLSPRERASIGGLTHERGVEDSEIASRNQKLLSLPGMDQEQGHVTSDADTSKISKLTPSSGLTSSDLSRTSYTVISESLVPQQPGRCISAGQDGARLGQISTDLGTRVSSLERSIGLVQHSADQILGVRPRADEGRLSSGNLIAPSSPPHRLSHLSESGLGGEIKPAVMTCLFSRRTTGQTPGHWPPLTSILNRMYDTGARSPPFIQEGSPFMPCLPSPLNFQRTNVYSHSIGSFRFKGSEEVVNMVHVSTEAFLERKFPETAIEGKGSRLTKKNELLMSVWVELPDLPCKIAWKVNDMASIVGVSATEPYNMGLDSIHNAQSSDTIPPARPA